MVGPRAHQGEPGARVAGRGTGRSGAVWTVAAAGRTPGWQGSSGKGWQAGAQKQMEGMRRRAAERENKSRHEQGESRATPPSR